MRIARITASGKPVEYEEGSFTVASEPSGLGAILEFERLDALAWESEEIRTWALSLPSQVTRQASEGAARSDAEPTPEAPNRVGHWLGRAFGTREKPRWINISFAVFALLLLTAFALGRPAYWFVYDRANPVQVRTDGELPNLPSMLGTSSHDTLRMLGTTDMPEWQDSPNSSLWDSTLQVRLPDLSNETDLTRPPGNVLLKLDFDRDGHLTRARLGINSDASGTNSHSELVRAVGVDGRLEPGYLEGYADSSLEMSFGHGVANGSWIEYSVTTVLKSTDAYSANLYDIYVGTLDAMMLPDDGFTAETAAATTGQGESPKPMSPPESDEAPGSETSPTGDSQIREDGTSAANLSNSSIDYAKQLGGQSHDGETLYVIIGASMNYEDLTQQRLDDATSMFGDMQAYFIIQKSDNFDGMSAGYFVAMEAYRDEAHAKENLEFAARGFDNPYIKRVVVRTNNPIPVYEDLVQGN